MDKRILLKHYGECYNAGDFSGLEPIMHENVSYEAFDCMYNVKFAESVEKVLFDSGKKDTSAYEGYYLYKGNVIKRLKECVLICEDTDLDCVRIVDIKSRRGKILSITGFDPKEHMYTRGKKISV